MGETKGMDRERTVCDDGIVKYKDLYNFLFSFI